MMSLEKIKKQIEELRQELNQLAKERELTDPEVVAASRMLDAALNEYYRLLQKKS